MRVGLEPEKRMDSSDKSQRVLMDERGYWRWVERWKKERSESGGWRGAGPLIGCRIACVILTAVASSPARLSSSLDRARVQNQQSHRSAHIAAAR